MLRVDRQHLEPEPEPIRRHPVASWRPHSGPTSENHPKVLLTTAEAMRHVNIHMAGQHFEHIVFGANQYACWLRCTQCETISPRIHYRFTVCMNCPERRRDDSEIMDIFHDIIEPEHDMAQTLCDMRWAPLTRHAVLSEELTEVGLNPGAGRLTGPTKQSPPATADGNPLEQPGVIHMSDDLRAEVSPLNTEQDATLLADRFSRGGLPFTVGQLHGGNTMKEESAYSDALQSNNDELDETRNNEAHPGHIIRQPDPCNAQGPCPSKPFEGLEQCSSWHQQGWNYLSHACPSHRRRCVNFQFGESTQLRVAEGYPSHRGYPVLKPPHTTRQALTRARDRVQDHEPYCGHEPYFGFTHIGRTLGVLPYSAGMDMGSGGTTSSTDRITGTLHGVDTRDTGYDMRQGYPSGIPSTYSASRTLLGRDGQDSEGVMENRPRPVVRGNRAHPTIRRTSDHEDSRRLASGLSADLCGTVGTEAQESYLGADRFCSWKTDRFR